MKYAILANGNLLVALEHQDDVAELREMLALAADPDHAFLADLLEYTGWMGNGHLYPLRPADIGALTDAPILTNAKEVDDDGKVVAVGAVWWFPQYESVSFADALLKDGHVVFTCATRADRQGDSQSEAQPE